MTGIAEMFAELDGYDRMAIALEIYAVRQRHAAVERVRDWRQANPEKFRQQAHAKHNRAWRARNRDKVREIKRAYRERNRDKVREAWRRNTAAYRARKAAAS